jgi:hypothetical protein
LVSAILDVSHGLNVLRIVNGFSDLNSLIVSFSLLWRFGLLSIVFLGLVAAEAHITGLIDVLALRKLVIYLLHKLLAIIIDHVELVQEFEGSWSFFSLQLVDVHFNLLRLEHFNANQIWSLFSSHKQA